MAPVRPSPASVREENVQRALIDALASLGYLVEQTTVRVKRVECPECHARFVPVRKVRGPDGKLRSVGYGATKGVSDLLVRHPSWPPALYVQVEVKGPRTPVSTEQRDKQTAGHLWICRDMAGIPATIAMLADMTRSLPHTFNATLVVSN